MLRSISHQIFYSSHNSLRKRSRVKVWVDKFNDESPRAALPLFATQYLTLLSPQHHSSTSQHAITMASSTSPQGHESRLFSDDKPIALADRMKKYEAPYDFVLPLNSPIIVRLDGHGFSRFTSHFCRPFDQRIHDAMIATCANLLHFFPQATVAYTQSDEITLVFPTGVQSFNDRVQKLSSLAASYCSVHFNKHLSTCLQNQPEPAVKASAFEALGTAHFDARFFAVPSLEEALNCLLWRCRNDAVRNAVSAFARTMYTTKQMHGKRTVDLVEMMKREKDVMFEDAVPKWAIEGCLMKREQFEHEGVNLKTGQTEKTMRTRVRVQERGIRDFNDEGLRIVGDKFW
jgi:tRNA(His) guanylyltransferase